MRGGVGGGGWEMPAGGGGGGREVGTPMNGTFANPRLQYTWTLIYVI